MKLGTAIGFTQWGNRGTEQEAFLPADRLVGVWLEFELRTQFLHYQHGVHGVPVGLLASWT